MSPTLAEIMIERMRVAFGDRAVPPGEILREGIPGLDEYLGGDGLQANSSRLGKALQPLLGLATPSGLALERSRDTRTGQARYRAARAPLDAPTLHAPSTRGDLSAIGDAYDLQVAIIERTAAIEHDLAGLQAMVVRYIAITAG